MLDLLVVGAGLSGLMAAYTAAKQKQQVRVVSKGLGAMHWTAGTIDLLGYTPSSPGEAVRRPLEVLNEFLPAHPSHPLALVGLESITAALASFATLAASCGLPYVGAENGQDNLFLPSPVGAARPAFLAPMAQAAGELSRPEPMLIVGFEGMRDFYPLLIAENLCKMGFEARGMLLPRELITMRRDANTVQLAAGLDDAAVSHDLGQRLKEIARAGERIGLPAIVGVKAHSEAMGALQEACEAPVFEIPTLPPSVPGIRLLRALMRELARMGVRIETGMEIVAAEADAADEEFATNRIHWMASKAPARPLRHHARNFLLATGGLLGGGFDSDMEGRVWEVILDLPLTIPQDRSKWFRPDFLNAGGQPIFRGGVRVNGAFQPVADSGTLIYDNLWAAGQMLAGADPIVERSVEGVAIVTGMAAGEAAASR